MATETGHSVSETFPDQIPMPAALERAFELQDEGKMDAAIAELETALAEANHTQRSLSFQDRITVALMLADFYVETATIEKACEMLAAEVSHADEVYRMVKPTGTLMEKREVMDGLTVIRDQHTQISLIGRPAPEISIKDWINSDPQAMTAHRGNVVLLEFWATWCKPCHSMFPKIKKLHSDYASRGLRVIALTRYYFSVKATAGSEESELELIQTFVREHGLEFPVGIAEDARTQMLYGAVGLPTFVLIDRNGLVRHFGRLGGDGTDPNFDEALRQCIEESG
jgi:thiol-disulfide isomerase/thioredoxin